MIVEIYGAGFRNKGAFLMMHAVMHAFKERYPDVHFAIDPMELDEMWGTPPEPIAHIFSLEPWYPRGKIGEWLKMLSMKVGDIVHPRTLQLSKRIARKQVNVFIDISGYRFGDIWLHCERTARRTRSITSYYKKKGIPVFFFPQMFGPFEKKGLRGEFGRILEDATLVYAREQTSFDILKKAYPAYDRFRLAADITIPLGRSTKAPEKSVAIIPNDKVYQKGKVVSGEAYIKLLRDVFVKVRERGYDARFVIHETVGRDKAHAVSALEGVVDDGSAYIVEEGDPLKLKALLAQQYYVVASRFHACVGALASGVPVIAIGWAHKYEELLSDFGIKDFILNNDDPLAKFEMLAQNLDVNRQVYSEIVRNKGDILEQSVDKMWDEVFNSLG